MSKANNVARLTKPATGELMPKKAVAPKNTAELRNFLLDQMCAVADGAQTSDSAKAICNYAQQIYNTMNMELRHAASIKNLGDTPVRAVAFDSPASG